MLTVRGNHDRACAGLEDLEWFNPVARAAAKWTHHQLTPENNDFVAALPKGPMPVDGFQVMHGSPLNEDEYMVSVSDVKPVFPYLEWPIAFFGHTHVQGGFEWVRNRVRSVGRPDPQHQEQMLLELDSDSAYLLNPGSVGQPRDGDPRAGYLVYDPDDRFLLFHRVAYDIPAAQAKILEAGLPDLLAHRLAVGR
jgi:diadenosine tetraphosphatase ApaH/serine/threonine PP2A family protein phosphatase